MVPSWQRKDTRHHTPSYACCHIQQLMHAAGSAGHVWHNVAQCCAAARADIKLLAVTLHRTARHAQQHCCEHRQHRHHADLRARLSAQARSSQQDCADEPCARVVSELVSRPRQCLRRGRSKSKEAFLHKSLRLVELRIYKNSDIS